MSGEEPNRARFNKPFIATFLLVGFESRWTLLGTCLRSYLTYVMTD